MSTGRLKKRLNNISNEDIESATILSRLCKRIYRPPAINDVIKICVIDRNRYVYVWKRALIARKSEGGIFTLYFCVNKEMILAKLNEYHFPTFWHY